MAASQKPDAPLGIVTDDDHVRVKLSHWNHIADVMQEQERTIKQLRVSNDALRVSAQSLGDEYDKVCRQRDALKAQLEGRTRELIAQHEAVFKNANRE